MDRLQKQGEQAYYRAEYATAMEKWQQGLEIANRSGNKKYISRFTTGIGVIYDNLGQYEKALAYYKKALSIAREIGDRRGEASDLGNMGVVFQNLGQYEKALSYYARALAINRETGNRNAEGDNFANLGVAHSDLGNYEKALVYYKKALAVFRENGDRRKEGGILVNMGVIFADMSQFEMARSYYRQALQISQEIGDQKGKGNVLGNLGVVHENLSEYEKALACYEKALAICREIGDQRGEGGNLTNIGVAYYRMGQYEKALSYYKQALGIKRRIGDRKGEASDLGSIGSVYDDKGQYEKALSNYKKALAIDREIGDRIGESADISNMGGVFQNIGRYENALKCYEESLALDRKIGDKMGESSNLTNMGIIYDDLGRYEKALTFYNQALTIDREIGNLRGESADIINIGVIYRNMGRYQKALAHFVKALEVKRKINDRGGEASALANLGIVYDDLSQYGKSLSYYERALAIDREMSNQTGIGSDLNNLGVLYRNLGQYKKALKYFTQALAIDREIGDRKGESSDLGNMGIAYSDLGQYEKALLYYKEALAIGKGIGFQSGVGDDLSNLGNLYHELGEYEKALEYYEQALAIENEIGDRRGEGNILNNMGVVYRDLGRYTKAKKMFSASMKLFREIGAPESLWSPQVELAGIEAKLGETDTAADFYELAINTVETIRGSLTKKDVKTSYMKNKIYLYNQFIELLLNLHQNHPDQEYDCKAIEIFERKQGRIFLEEMGKSGAKNFASIPDRILDKEKELDARLVLLQKHRADEGSKPEKDRNMKRIRELETQIEAVKAEQQQLQEEIKTDYPDYYALKYPKPVSLKELQKNVLRPSEMMLIYSVMEGSTCLWAISKDHFALHPLETNEKDLVEKVEIYRNLGIAPSGRDLRGKVIHLKTQEKYEIPDLYALLFTKAVRKAITSAKTIYIIPTGPLYMLPFEALKNEHGKYLIEDHALAYLSSASLLKILRDAQARKKEKAEHPLLAFADPVYGEKAATSDAIRSMRNESYRSFMDSEFTPLPETEDEVRTIKDILKAPDQSKPLWLGQKASRSSVFKLNQSQTLDDYRYLVFACHGVLPDDITRITQPALVLSHPDPTTQENGFLTMVDVFGLSLNADLVTLSACNTGRGKTVKGEGIMGLTRAFMYAGTPAVTVTLWSVESHSAKALNVGFFKNLKEGKSRAEALREIKLAMLRGAFGERWKQPYFWAPVVMFGDGK